MQLHLRLVQCCSREEYFERSMCGSVQNNFPLLVPADVRSGYQHPVRQTSLASRRGDQLIP